MASPTFVSQCEWYSAGTGRCEEKATVWWQHGDEQWYVAFCDAHSNLIVDRSASYGWHLYGRYLGIEIVT